MRGKQGFVGLYVCVKERFGVFACFFWVGLYLCVCVARGGLCVGVLVGCDCMGDWVCCEGT